MQPEIITRDEFIVVGIRTVLEIGSIHTGSLWKNRLLPRHAELQRADGCYYGVFNILPDDKLGGRYEYVAGVASGLEDIPLGMVGWVVPEGKYARVSAAGLDHIGRVCRDIIAEWLPDSGYKMTASPMFASTKDRQPDSPGAMWEVHVPVETPEVVEALKKWDICMEF